jgi:electron transfer flavoprotein alpha subunit
MEKILLLAHTDADGRLAKAALESVRAAAELRGLLAEAEFVVGLVGGEVTPAARQIAHCGASRFLAVCGSSFGVSRYATDAAAAEAIGRAANPTLVVAAGTARWQRVLPGLAVRLNGRVDSHVTRFEPADGALAIHRWFYRQRMEGVLQRAQRPWILLVDPGCYPAWEGPADDATVERLDVSAPDTLTRTSTVGYREPTADQQTIRPEAELLFVAGAGWTKKQADGQVHASEAERLILDFLRQSRASLGSSKSLVDLGTEGQRVLPFLTHLNQVGQTGSTPRHPKGLAACCHGEEPHTVGWRFIHERRAINLDPNCGWARGKADVLYVADAFEVMSKVNALLA